MAVIDSAVSVRKTFLCEDSCAPRPLEIRDDASGPVYRLHAFGARICVERRMPVTARRELACYAMFDDESQFLQWCDADAIKLSHPLLHRRLRQAGCDLLASTGSQAHDRSANE